MSGLVGSAGEIAGVGLSRRLALKGAAPGGCPGIPVPPPYFPDGCCIRVASRPKPVAYNAACNALPGAIAGNSGVLAPILRLPAMVSEWVGSGCFEGVEAAAARPASGPRIIYETGFNRALDRDGDTKKPAGRAGGRSGRTPLLLRRIIADLVKFVKGNFH